MAHAPLSTTRVRPGIAGWRSDMLATAIASQYRSSTADRRHKRAFYGRVYRSQAYMNGSFCTGVKASINYWGEPESCSNSQDVCLCELASLCPRPPVVRGSFWVVAGVVLYKCEGREFEPHRDNLSLFFFHGCLMNILIC